MWFLVILTLLNASLPHWSFVLENRIQIAGMPVSIFDGLLAFGLLLVLLRRSQSARVFRADRVHPAQTIAVLLFLLGTVAGVIGSILGEYDPRRSIPETRDFLSLPLSMIIGYSLLANLRSAARFPYAQALAGLCTAVLIMAFFTDRAQQMSSDSGLDMLRSLEYPASYAGIAGCLLLYAVVSGHRLFPPWLGVVFLGVCLVGQAATLSRSDWLATGAALIWTYTLLPRERRGSSLTKAAIAIPIIVVFLWAGIYATSQLTGTDFGASISARAATMLPGNEDTTSRRAWDTRMPGLTGEFAMWLQSPLWGQGIGVQSMEEQRTGVMMGYHHNSWTSTLAQTGLLGGTAAAIAIFGTIVVGRRMIRANTDRGSTLLGALGTIAACYFLVLGMSTGAFGSLRSNILIGLIIGMTLRARAMQLTQIRLAREEQPMEQPIDPGFGGARSTSPYATI